MKDNIFKTTVILVVTVILAVWFYALFIVAKALYDNGYQDCETNIGVSEHGNRSGMS